MADKSKCQMCGGKLVKVREENVSDTRYLILRCEKCGREIAKSVE